MAGLYQKFLRQNISLAPLGIESRMDAATYFCTPKGASIIGWAGVDGIHYCFIRGFGETVFAVSPMNTPGNYVHPLANSFEDFLCLLLACGDSAALEQAWQWDREQFYAFLAKNSPTEEQQKVLSEIASTMELSPIDDPWQFLREVQLDFDYSKIRYTDDFYDTDMNPGVQPQAPEWKVFFDGNFWGHHGRDHAGKEILIEKDFQWGGNYWRIPAAYSCAKGLVIDFCMRVDPERIQAFMNKWDLSIENENTMQPTREQRQSLEAEDPLCFRFRAKPIVNGKELRGKHGCGVVFNPCLPDHVTDEAEWALDHYQLDPSYGWAIWRESFLWATKRRPDMKSISVSLTQEKIAKPGPHFRVTAPGDSFTFHYPATEKCHTLTVQEYGQQTMDFSRMPEQGMDYPPYYMAMTYTISPPLPDGALSVCDCLDSDRPRPRQDGLHKTDAASAAAIGIIGGADGPTALIFGGSEQGKLQSACSALHFEPVREVEWSIVFYSRQYEDMNIVLL